MTPHDFVELLGEERATAILRCGSEEVARRAMHAAIAGGFRIVEFTMTVPGVLDLIAEFAADDELVVGAGTVLTVDEAEEAVDHGARFLVSPVTDEAVIDRAAELGVAAMPGGHTPTELHRAHRAGAPLQKLFPAPGIGPAFVRSVLGPLPFLRLVPTNGITLDNVGDWLDAGAYALGFVAPLFPAGLLAEKRFDMIESRAQELLRRVHGSA